MPPPKVIHTVESVLARAHEIGDCMEWGGYLCSGVPNMTVNRRCRPVRRFLLELLGRPARPGSFVGTTCGNPLCVNPEHIIERSMFHHMRRASKLVDHNCPVRIAKLQKHAAVRGILSKDDVLKILNDPRCAREVAEEIGCSKSLVTRVRRGQAYRQVNASVNPFAGLMR